MTTTTFVPGTTVTSDWLNDVDAKVYEATPISATTISATSTITSTLANGAVLTNSAASTSQKWIYLANTGGNLQVGIESSAGGTIITGSSAYDATLVTASGTGLAFSCTGGAAMHMRLSATGLAVTGTLTNTVSDGAVSGRMVASTGRIRYRPYVDATFGAAIESTNTAESAYLPLSLIGSTVVSYANTSSTIKIGGSDVSVVSSTGLAVTGTLSATGLATFNSSGTIGAGLVGLKVLGAAADNNWGGVIELNSNNGTTVLGKIAANSNGVLTFYGGSIITTTSATGLAVTGQTTTNSLACNLVTNTGATYTVLTTDHTIVQTTAASTYTLPAAASFTNRIIHVVTQFAGTVISASSNVVPIAGGAAGTAILAATAGKFATLQSNGTNWIIIAAN